MMELPRPTPPGFTCSVVVPCYNEAVRFRTEAFERFLSTPTRHDIRLLFVNDGSRDRTLVKLEELRQRFPDCVQVLDLQPNRGKAEATRQGMLRVIADGRSQFTGFWDADLATPLSEIPAFLNLFAEQPHLNLILGARVRLLGRHIHRQPLRHYLGRCFATVVSILLQMAVYDTQCGAKLFRITPDLNEILREPFHSRWIFDVEILARLLSRYRGDTKRLEGELYEFPLPLWTDVEGSKVRPGDFLRALGELAFIYRRHLSKSRAAS
jgi:glycosyltransferase involved in cell wall biosynthesis